MKKFILVILLLGSNSFAASEKEVERFVIEQASLLKANTSATSYKSLFMKKDPKVADVIVKTYNFIVMRNCVEKFNLNICQVVLCKQYFGRKCRTKETVEQLSFFREGLIWEETINENREGVK